MFPETGTYVNAGFKLFGFSLLAFWLNADGDSVTWIICIVKFSSGSLISPAATFCAFPAASNPLKVAVLIVVLSKSESASLTVGSPVPVCFVALTPAGNVPCTE